MTKRLRVKVFRAGYVLVLACVLCVSSAPCDEGMWIPQELPDEVMSEMKDRGCQLSREDIYNTKGTGVANAVVRLGSTGSFVSPDGLILTNHHVAFGAVQRMSSPEKDYIELGFLARTKADEAPAVGYVAYVVQSVQDVTEDILSAVQPSMSPLERHEALERRIKESVREAEAGRDVYCEIRPFFGGSKYLLYTFLKIKDVRVVYVPSRAIGEYGGDIDNWMWPRHTGDFSFLRAYVAPDGETAEFSEQNVPYRPKRHLKIAPEGLNDGDFAMVIGFPGSTNRYLTSYALADFEHFEYPQRIRLYKKMLEILEAQSGAEREASVRVASRIKGINNRLKNNEGMLEGFQRFSLVRRQNDEEREYRTKLQTDPEASEAYRGLLAEFASLYAERSSHAMKDLLLDFAVSRYSLLGQAMMLYKWSVEKQKDDLDRDPDYMNRRIPDLKRDLKVFQTQLHVASDRELLGMYLREMLALPNGQRAAPVDELLEGKSGVELESALKAFLDEFYGSTKLHRVEERLRMFDLSHEELVEQGDSFIELAAKLFPENEARIERKKSFSGKLHVLAPKWIETVTAVSGRSLYSDANGTMRLNFGDVTGYSPRDAVEMHPFTTFRGVVEKHTGVAPFDCPSKIMELGGVPRTGAYVSAELGDVPVNLLTTHDSTGGNSGSPLLNSRGELVGCLFDGNYESMTSDFLFQNDITRSIHVDIRYILYVTEFVDGADNVLAELGLK
ncbi:MAG: S46 family peptidase [Candidatus Eiseniibacteriota bacterium]|nr:MAG: S46 family peptidase [Candidatus Eisenbacteria bacterium]